MSPSSIAPVDPRPPSWPLSPVRAVGGGQTGGGEQNPLFLSLGFHPVPGCCGPGCTHPQAGRGGGVCVSSQHPAPPSVPGLGWVVPSPSSLPCILGFPRAGAGSGLRQPLTSRTDPGCRLASQGLGSLRPGVLPPLPHSPSPPASTRSHLARGPQRRDKAPSQTRPPDGLGRDPVPQFPRL